MGKAQRPKELDKGWEGRVPGAEIRKALRSAEGLKEKTFDQLTPEDKDVLLKALAIKAGLISDDPETTKKRKK